VRNKSTQDTRSPYATSAYEVIVGTIASIPKNTKEYVSRHERFVRSPPKSFFKSLFLGDTPLARNFKKMGERNGVLKGLKDQECERGNRSKRPPIPYVPVVDEVQDTLNANSKESRTETIKLPNKTEFRASVWYTGTPEEFLNHVKGAIHACERMGLFSDYAEAVKGRLTSKRGYDAAVSALTIAKAVTERTTVIETQIKEHRATRDGHKKTNDEWEQKRKNAAEGFFSLYANLLSVEARIAWDKIVSRQIGVTPWTNLKGKTQNTIQEKTKASFDDCTKFHLMTVFSEDAAEQQKFYISNCLKKPTRVTVRAFFTRVEQLNSYVALLPSLFNSPRATPATKRVEQFDEAELANVLLRICPDSWQNQYDLIQETIPQDSRKLLVVLENIEKLTASTTVQAKPPNSNNGNAKANGKTDTNGKRKNTDSSSGRIPRKKRAEKRHCVLCSKYGGAEDTHNTKECAKWDSDGKLKSSWGDDSKSAGKKKKSDGNAFAQLLDRFSKMEKTIKKVKKSSASRKKRRHYDSDSDSDSE